MRTSQKQLQTIVDNINYFTDHKVKISFTQGCGVYLTINGTEYNKKLTDDTHTGIENKKAKKLLSPLWEEAVKNALDRQK